MDTEYSKLQTRPRVLRDSHTLPERRYWKKFGAPISTQQIGIVSHIHFSPAQAYDYAITSSTRVIVYDHRTHAVKRTISRFPDTAYGATFRNDGQLIAAGCENGHVLIFNTSSRAVLRQFKQHKAATRMALFSTNKTQVFSGSDDTTLRIWDLASGDQVARMVGHTDYVRAGAVVSDAAILSGSYDHSVRMWDTRTRQSQMCLDHGSPVESVAVFTNGRIAASAGGTTVKLWDLAAGGRALQTISNHQKTVTCAHAIDVRDSEGVMCSRLLTGSLDGHVKVYDMDSLSVAHAYKYPAGVTAVAVAPDLSCMVVALADRSMVVRRHKNGLGAISAIRALPTTAVSIMPEPFSYRAELYGSADAKVPKKDRKYGPRLTASSAKYFFRGQGEKASETDVVVHSRRRMHLQPYDKLLKKFAYVKALDAAVETGHIAVVVALIDDLSNREGLKTALQRRSADSLVPLLKMMAKNIAHPQHSKVAMSTIGLCMDLHPQACVSHPELVAIMSDIRGRVIAELKLQRELKALSGVVEMLTAM